jgi:serine/threonine-protein kinase HipA
VNPSPDPQAAYQPRDELYLWWLAHPSQPRLIGDLSLVMGHRSVGLRYADEWLKSGFALSQDLALRRGLFVPAEKDAAAGAVDDARPDRWGERVIRRFEKSARLSLLEFLLFAGDDRYGALGVSLQRETYEPWPTAPAARLVDLPQMAEVVRKVLANEPVPELERRLIRPGVSLGGARPKSLIQIDGQCWLVKFSEGEDADTELIEHAAMTLAARCGIQVAATRALPVAGRHAIAVRRFDREVDREGDGEGLARRHAISAQVVLRASGDAFGYPQLAQQLRRLAAANAIAQAQQELFRRMVFNILIDNTDDHEKNHALLRQADGTYALSPAFDVLPAAQGLGVQAMDVGERGTESSIDNAMSQAAAFGLRPDAAMKIVSAIAAVVDQWREHFQAAGVRDVDIQMLEQYIDGANLGRQRADVLATGRSAVPVSWSREK